MTTPERTVVRLPHDSNTWILNPQESAVFVDTLLHPPTPNAALRAAAERYKAQRETQTES